MNLGTMVTRAWGRAIRDEMDKRILSGAFFDDPPAMPLLVELEKDMQKRIDASYVAYETANRVDDHKFSVWVKTHHPDVWERYKAHDLVLKRMFREEQGK